MSPLRVVLYAEGAGEMLGPVSLLPAPGEPLSEQMLGPAHILARRALTEARGLSAGDVRFDSPLRTRTGRLPRGSDLLHPRTLLQLLTWARPSRQPDLAIVLVDADGDRQRRRKIQSTAAKAAVPTVVAVAAQEFEAWRIADHKALSRVLRTDIDPVVKPERLQPAEAKTTLAAWLSRSGAETPSEARRQIAAVCDLGVVKRRCRSFEQFLGDLRTVVS